MNLRIFSTSGGNLSKFLPNVTQDFKKFLDWIPLDDWVAHDLETTYTDNLLDREMRTAAYFHGDTVWVLFLDEMTKTHHTQLNDVMRRGKFVIQNVDFEIKEWLKKGVTLRRFYCTMLTEKLLGMGLDEAGNDLGTIVNKYVGVVLDKELQTSFKTNQEIDDEQLKYIAKDVIYLLKVKGLQELAIANHDHTLQKQFPSSKNRGLKKTNFWNHEFIKVIADLEFKGIKLDVDKWKDLYEEAVPMVKVAEKHLNEIVARDFYSRACAYKYLYAEDEFVEKIFTSAALRLKLFRIIYLDLENTSQLEIKKYLMKNDPDWPEDLKPTSSKLQKYLSDLDEKKPKYVALKLFLLNMYEPVQQLFYQNFYQDLIDNELLILKGTVLINWASPVQRKEIFHWIDPTITTTDRPHLEEIAYKHELIATYLEEYQKYIGLTTKFGINYIDSLDSDGRARTRINPVLNTGRISSSSPNILNVVNDKRYRACFIAEEGYKYVMSDYNSEELVLTAHFSREKSWLDAIRNGHDLHSVNAEAIFGKKWKDAEEPGCEYAKSKGKCNCKEHKVLRTNSKSASFGAIYGISEHGLAFNIKTTVDEAKDILTGFFKKSPNVKKFLDGMAQYALRNGFSPELVFGSCRFVDKRKFFYDKGSIARTASNFSIQGAGSSVLKIATVLLRRHIKARGDDATIINIPYDEIIMEVKEDLAEYYQDKLKYYMELAGKLALGTDILTADVPTIGDYWIH